MTYETTGTGHKFLTVVYRIPDDLSAEQFTSSKFMSACSWSHALRERDIYKARLHAEFGGIEDHLDERL